MSTEPGSEPEGGKDEPPKKRRSPRNVKAAARLLHKEARRIVNKHESKLGPDVTASIRAAMDEIDATRAAQDWAAVEDAAELLDDLLHEHASFARKSAIRETLENIGVAVIVALGLRSCFYEPFKIPSGSMMPTLRAGDHIFVNKYAYGVQIPLTTTVVGEDWIDSIERGDVVVFRYPINPSDDYIKRVIGLPGDTVRVDGDRVSIMKAGEPDFTPLEREKLDEPCRNADGAVVEACSLYREKVDDHDYVVRFVHGASSPAEHPRVIEVPEDSLLVLGDNRRDSADSLRWIAQVEAVSADSILTIKDLRDLTEERLFTLRHPLDTRDNQDPSQDHVLYLAEHRSPQHGVQLEVWRSPTLSVPAVASTLAGSYEAGADGNAGAIANADALRVGETDQARTAVFSSEELDLVVGLRCGKALCLNEGELVGQMRQVVDRLRHEPDLDARDLVEIDRGVRYAQHGQSRADLEERFLELTYRRPGKPESEAGTVRMRVWRRPGEGLEVIRDAALAQAGSSQDSAAPAPALGEDAWVVERADGHVAVVAEHVHEVVYVLECGRDRCKDAAALEELAADVNKKIPAAAGVPERMREMLPQREVGDWPESPSSASATYNWDRVVMEGSIRGGDYQISLQIQRGPAEGLEAKVAAWRADAEHAEDDESVGAAGYVSSGRAGTELAFAVPETQLAVHMSCGSGLCPDTATARAIAQRIGEKALDESVWLIKDAERPRPFVPRGNVKGRAERIWLPWGRFWRAID